MRTRKVDGEVVRILEIPEDLITNEEFFKSEFEQIIRHYAMILDVEEIKEFSLSVIDSHF